MENNEIKTYRTNLVNEIESSAKRFYAACVAIKDPQKPLEDGGWNAHQVASHTRDVELHAYGARVRRTLAENDPMFEPFDGDAYNKDHYHADEPLKNIADEFLNDVTD